MLKYYWNPNNYIACFHNFWAIYDIIFWIIIIKFVEFMENV